MIEFYLFPRQPGEIEQGRVQKMRRARVHQRTEHDLPPTGAVLFPSVEDLLDLLALQPVLRAAQVAGDDRIVHRAGKAFAIVFGHMGKGAQHEEIAFLVQQFRRHRGHAPAMARAAGGEVIFSFWGWEASREGLFRAAEVGLKANAILFSLMALIGIMEPSVLGHALYRLKIPIKLVHLFLFTVRYIDVFYKEYKTMRMAMKARGFVPRTDLHTLRSIGYLVGMMLVRSLERSDRIMEAMKCRGFDGRFYILDTMKSGPRDRIFAVVSAVTLLGLLAVGYL